MDFWYRKNRRFFQDFQIDGGMGSIIPFQHRKFRQKNKSVFGANGHKIGSIPTIIPPEGTSNQNAISTLKNNPDFVYITNASVSSQSFFHFTLVVYTLHHQKIN